MNNVELYVQSNSKQRHDAQECLEMYAKRMQFKNNGTVIDIGCGDGLVTTNVLKKFLPPSNKILGIDKNEDMIEFANANYGSDSTYFAILDIEKDIPENMHRKYNQAFSFYALHWTREPEKVFKNIYDLLDDGGECLLMFLGNVSTYAAYRRLATTTRWGAWLNDVEQYLSPFHDSQDPAREIKDMLYTVGFKEADVVYKPKQFRYDDVDSKIRTLKSVNPFRIPEELSSEFVEDVLHEMHRIDRMNRSVNYSLAIRTFYYNMIYVYAMK